MPEEPHKYWLSGHAAPPSKRSGASGHPPISFDRERPANAHLHGAICAKIVTHSTLGNFSVKQFDVIPNMTEEHKRPDEIALPK
jgi:hypothetical protein